MDKRQLGTDGPLVSVIAFGAWPVGGGLGSVPEEQGIATVKAALEVGMTFIDTAEGYQSSETVVGKAIRGRRDEVFLATKLSGSDHSAEHMTSAIETSLRTLGSDYIDLYQLHSPSPESPHRRHDGEPRAIAGHGQDTLYRHIQLFTRTDTGSHAIRCDS